VLIHADARAIPLKDESVHCCVTSPPYCGLRDYGVAGQIGLERTPEEYVAVLVEVFREVRRVLKADGTLWLNLGDSYQNAKGKAHGVDPKQPARRHGLRPQDVTIPGLKPKDLVGIPWRVAFALQADGWWLRSDIIWSKPNPMPESVTDRPTKAHEYVFLLAKSERYYYSNEAIRESSFRAGEIPGGSIKTSILQPSMRAASQRPVASTRNARSVWTIATTPYPGAHFATFPPELARRCILAGCPPGGSVLDPFVGSGTTVMVARRLGREGIGLDINPKYLDEQAAQRIKTDRGFAFGTTP